MRLPCLVLLLSIAPVATAINAQWPNGGAPCSAGTTLQECIDAVPDGSTITLNIAAPIDEAPDFDQRTLTLRGYPGFRPSFAFGRGISVYGGAVRIENLLLDGGEIRAASTQLTVHRVEIRNVGSGGITLFEGWQPLDGPMALRVSESTLIGSPNADQQDLLSASRTSAGTLDVVYEANTLRPSAGQTYAATVYCGATCTARIARNRLRGANYNGGIQLRGTTGGTLVADVVGNLVVGQNGNSGASGAIVASLDEAHGNVRMVNNTIADSRRGIAMSARADLGGSVQGLVANNLMTRLATYSVCVDAGVALQNNLTWDNDGDIGPLPNTGARNAAKGFIGACQPPGSGNVFADPKLDAFYRLRADSPARDAARLDVLQAEIDASRAIDLDGMRRIVGAAPDIGAFEHDMRLRTERVHGMPSGLLAHPRSDDALHPYPVYTPFAAPPRYPTPAPSPLLLMPYPDNRWRILPFEGVDQLLDGTGFAIFAPRPQRGVARVEVDGSNSRLGGTAVLTDTVDVTEGDPMFFARVTTGSGAGSPTCRSGGVSDGGYVLRHADDAPMNPGTAFHVYTQDASPNVFTFETSYYNTGPFGQYIALDHPLLNGNACARILVAPADCANPHHIATRFGSTRWEIYTTDGAAIEYGTRFDVLVDPRQIDAECGVTVFADSLE